MDNPATERKIKSRAQPCSRSAPGKGRASARRRGGGAEGRRGRGRGGRKREAERTKGVMYAGYTAAASSGREGWQEGRGGREKERKERGLGNCNLRRREGKDRG